MKKSPWWLRIKRIWSYDSMKTALMRAQAEKTCSHADSSLNNYYMTGLKQDSRSCKCCQRNSARHNADT